MYYILLPLLLLLHTRLYSLYGLSHPPYLRLVVDNNYSDGSPSAICRYCRAQVTVANINTHKLPLPLPVSLPFSFPVCIHTREDFQVKKKIIFEKQNNNNKNESNRFVCNVWSRYVNIWTAYISIIKLHILNRWCE